MSRQNKVTPGMYTQRGRLTQDDAARELRKQSAIASQHTWQPVNTEPWAAMGTPGGVARETERSADDETIVEVSPRVEKRPAARATRKTATKTTPSNARARAAKAKTAVARKSKRTTATAKSGARKATKRTMTKPTRKAVGARKSISKRAAPRTAVGGRAAARRATKRRKG